MSEAKQAGGTRIGTDGGPAEASTSDTGDANNGETDDDGAMQPFPLLLNPQASDVARELTRIVAVATRNARYVDLPFEAMPFVLHISGAQLTQLCAVVAEARPDLAA